MDEIVKINWSMSNVEIAQKLTDLASKNCLPGRSKPYTKEQVFNWRTYRGIPPAILVRFEGIVEFDREKELKVSNKNAKTAFEYVLALLDDYPSKEIPHGGKILKDLYEIFMK